MTGENVNDTTSHVNPAPEHFAAALPGALRTYEVRVGSLRVQIDFESLAVYVLISDEESERTSHVGPGLLLDMAADGRIIGVEVLSERQEDEA